MTFAGAIGLASAADGIGAQDTRGCGNVVHDAVLSAPRTRAPMFSASTVSVMISAPVQASCCQSS